MVKNKSTEIRPQRQRQHKFARQHFQSGRRFNALALLRPNIGRHQGEHRGDG
jgi:hypothetical protein